MLAERSGWTREATRLGPVGSGFGLSLAGRTAIEWLVGATAPSFQASKESVIVA
jgi:hypothetical protein